MNHKRRRIVSAKNTQFEYRLSQLQLDRDAAASAAKSLAEQVCLQGMRECVEILKWND
jgi:hypothetical protein